MIFDTTKKYLTILTFLTTSVNRGVPDVKFLLSLLSFFSWVEETLRGS